MPLLKLNTDQGLTTLNLLRNAVEAIRAEVLIGCAATDSLVGGAWDAPAALQFLDQVNLWRQQTDSTLEVLADLSNRLGREIEQWEQTAAMFGAGVAGSGNFGTSVAGGVQSGIVSPNYSGGGGGGSWGSGSAPPYSSDSNFDYDLEDSSRFDGTVVENTGFYRKEDEFYANLIHEEIGISDSWQQSESTYALGALGTATATAGFFGYEIGGTGQFGFSDDGLAGKVTAGAEAYIVEAELTADVAGAEVAVEAQLGASIGGEGEIEIDLMEGEIELEGEIGAFAGVSVEGEVTKSIGPAEIGVEGEIGVGIGASAEGEIEFEDGKFKFDGNISAYYGVGGGFGYSFEIDIPEAAESIVDIGSQGVDIVGDLTGWW
jgi:hypothetical protein